MVTLVRAHLWPASPQRPHIAFTFDLLDWAEALLLECQVAMKDLCKALYFRSPHLVVKVCAVFINFVFSINLCVWFNVKCVMYREKISIHL